MHIITFMKLNFLKTSTLACCFGLCRLFSQTLCAQQCVPSPDDQDWKFTLGDPADAQSPELDDRAWRTLNVPHDWSIEGEPEEKAPSGSGGGFMPTGIGWYRKHLVIPQNASGKRIFIEFEGIMANIDVWTTVIIWERGHTLQHFELN
jgi:beta-galactosidase